MKLLLADDHTLFRDALAQYISGAQPDSIIEVAKNLAEAKETLDHGYIPDLVLLDLQMPGMNGIDGFSDMLEAYPDILFGLMSGTAEDCDIQAVMDLGAAGYFPKTLSGKYLLNAIRLVLSGGRFLPLDERNRVLPAYFSDIPNRRADGHGTSATTQYTKQYADDKKQHKRDRTPPSSQNLTPREEHVLSCLMHGDSNKEIARKLDIQVVTVKLHVRAICRKLGAQNRTQAVLKALENGYGERA